ncbi:Protein CBG08973 [Caenorhabditis briggsae]|uniref:Protein CBG08973 n=4 Tax=Caenorhabditis briggsae TaxID=6238 RepID=A8X840_CAEBR|nr:Protein CBG08973 [Caenorhabditis briggsae]ULT99660.1 hypothetical protein L3Y34_000746 [Caenorhabditis briggsae]CAP28801.2 Protein CBG08973 [Caenorhabditis briggsae]
MPREESTKDAEKEKVMRSRRGTVETELSALNALQSSLDVDDAPYRARLYQLFGHIEKEFDTLYAENCALSVRARIVQLTQTEGEAAANVVTQEVFGVQESGAKSSRKAIQMGQKLRTALRGPPVFRDGSKFRLSRYLEGHKDGVWHVAADSARNICASASADQTARVWSLESGACLATYLGHTGSVNCVAISSTCAVNNSEGSGTAAGLLLATASGDESTHIWKVPSNNAPLEQNSSEEEEENHGGNRDPNNILGLEHNKRNNETNEKSDGHRIRVPVIRLTGHRAPVICCEWLAGGQQMVTASWDRTANIWDVEKGEVVNILSGHESELNHCSTHPNHKLVLTSSKDSTFRLWDFRESIQSVAVFQGHQDSVTSVSFNTDYRIVSSSDDATVKIWDLRNMRTPLATIRLSSPANRVAVSKTHAVVAIPQDNRHVRIYDLNGNRLPRMPNRRCHERMVTCCAWLDEHPTNNLLTSGFDRMVAAWKVNTTTSS